MASKKPSKEAGMSTSQKVGIGVGLTAAAVAAAGAYFLAGSKNAKQNRKQVKSWMLKAKAEVLEGLEKAEAMTEAEFMTLVNAVGTTYASVKDASKTDIAEFKREMKAHWPKIVKESAKAVKTIKKTAKKASAPKAAKKAAPKKAAKKVAKKAA